MNGNQSFTVGSDFKKQDIQTILHQSRFGIPVLTRKIQGIKLIKPELIMMCLLNGWSPENHW